MHDPSGESGGSAWKNLDQDVRKRMTNNPRRSHVLMENYAHEKSAAS